MNNRSNPITAVVSLLCVLASSSVAHGQAVIASVVTKPPPPAAAKSEGEPKPRISPATIASAFAPTLPLFRRGALSVRPHLLYRLLDAEGLLNAGQLEDSSSIIQTIAPGVLLEFGNNVSLDYTYIKNLYSNPIFRDDSEHHATFAAGFTRGNWMFGLSQMYGRASPTLVETAQQTPQENYSTEANASYELGQRTRINLGIARTSRNVDETRHDPQWTTADWTSWSSTNVVQYIVSSQLDIAGGVIVGYDSVNPGADMEYSQPFTRVTWRPTKKISATAQVGIEKRRFTSGDLEPLENPVYNASLLYEPVDTTRLRVAGNRSFAASYFSNSAVESTGWSAGVEQRLLQRFYLTAAYAQQETAYLATSFAFLADRVDTSKLLSLRLSRPILGRGSLTLLYDHGRNLSNIAGFSFRTRQAGLELSYRF